MMEWGTYVVLSVSCLVLSLTDWLQSIEVTETNSELKRETVTDFAKANAVE